MDVSVQTADFDPGEVMAKLGGGRADIGAVVSFVGLVRNFGSGSEVQSMTLEHYPGMTEQALEDIVDQARRRWELQGVTVIHRVGRLEPGDRIVMVAVASPHRGEAFAACEFIIDYLKTKAPFWKKERTPDGERWVEARDGDYDTAARWRG